MQRNRRSSERQWTRWRLRRPRCRPRVPCPRTVRRCSTMCADHSTVPTRASAEALIVATWRRPCRGIPIRALSPTPSPGPGTRPRSCGRSPGSGPYGPASPRTAGRGWPRTWQGPATCWRIPRRRRECFARSPTSRLFPRAWCRPWRRSPWDAPSSIGSLPRSFWRVSPRPGTWPLRQ